MCMEQETWKEKKRSFQIPIRALYFSVLAASARPAVDLAWVADEGDGMGRGCSVT